MSALAATEAEFELPQQKAGEFEPISTTITHAAETAEAPTPVVKARKKPGPKPKTPKGSKKLVPPAPPNEPVAPPPSAKWPTPLEPDPTWTTSPTGQYWRKATLGTFARPTPGTRLLITAGEQYGHCGATHGVVEGFDGRWHDSQFPVRLYVMLPDGELRPNGLVLLFSTKIQPGTASDAAEQEFWPAGFELADGQAVSDDHVIRKTLVRVTLLARRPVFDADAL